MKIGVPKEIKNHENRVAMTPAGVVSLTDAGHSVYIESGAGLESGFTDEAYENAGAIVVSRKADVWEPEMIIKVKEPLPEEYPYLREGQILFAYLHLATAPQLTQVLMDKKVTAIAYETVQHKDQSLPLLTPMSQIAGRMAAQIGAQLLEKPKGGKGVLLGGIPGVRRSKVTIIGGGVVGENAAKIAVGLGANVTILDLNAKRLIELDELFGNSVNTLMSNPMNIRKEVVDADLVIGAVLIPGARAPKLVTDDMVAAMPDGSVVVDIAIDQGGIFETSDRVTTHDRPTYTKHGVLHYAVANMPGAVPHTATVGLTNVTVPYAMELAEKGVARACLANDALCKGINVYKGYIVSEAVAEAHNMPYRDVRALLDT